MSVSYSGLAAKSLLNIINNASQTLLGAVLGIILARCLLPDGLGVYQLYMSAATIIATMGTLGLGHSGLFFINAQKISRTYVVWNLVTASLVISLLAAAIMMLLPLMTSLYFGHLPIWALAVFSAAVGASLVNSILRYLFLADLEMGKILISGFLPRTLPLVVIGGYLVFHKLDVPLSLIAFSIGTVAGTIYILYSLPEIRDPRHMKIDLTLMKRMLIYGYPISIFLCLHLVMTNASVLLLRSLIANDFSQIGYFGRAIALANLVVLIPGSIGPILYAHWSKSRGAIDVATVELATRLNGLLGILVFIVVFVLAGPLVLILYGELYSPVVLPLRIIALSTVFKAVSDVWLNLLIAQGHSKVAPIILMGSLVVLIIFFYVLVPKHGIIGAAIATLLSSLGTMSLSFLAVRKQAINRISFYGFLTRPSDASYLLSALKSVARRTWRRNV